MQFHIECKRNRFGKKVCVGSTLNLGICSIFWGNFEEILGNPGEIPHIGRKTLGVYRVNTASLILKPFGDVKNITVEGTVSQIFYLGPSFYFI